MDSLFDVSSKTVLVTGGSRGIGRMIAAGFVERGAKVYISSRKEAELRATADEIGAIAVPARSVDEAGARRSGRRDRRAGAELHVLVNNAGATWGAPLHGVPRLSVRQGLLDQRQRPVPPDPGAASAAGKGGRVRAIRRGSSWSARSRESWCPTWENYAYPASKAAIHMLTRQLASRLSPTITVNAIAPGPLREQDDGFHLRRRSRCRRGVRAHPACGVPASRPTWRAPRFFSPAGPARTSPVR